MAKGNFLTQVVRGKLGNMVGYKVANSADKVSQGWRGYTATIKNPQTAAQAAQRMKMGVITRFYQNLAPIIRRGFENVPYGAKSYQKFLSVNLANMNGPYVEKGRRTLVPGQFVISEGSLLPISIIGVKQTSGENPLTFLQTDLDVLQPDSLTGTVGTLSERLIANNTDIQEGDQITFVLVTATENLDYIYRFASFVVDSTSSASVSTIGGGAWDFRGMSGGGGSGFTLSFRSDMTDEVPIAGAVIQSREKEDGSGYLRSSSSMWVNMDDTDVAQYWWPEYYQIALASYMSGDASESDWPTDPADSPTNDGLVMVPATATVGETSQSIQVLGLQRDGETLILFRTVDGQRRPLWTDGKPYWLVISGQRHELLLSEITPNSPATQYYSSYGTL